MTRHKLVIVALLATGLLAGLGIYVAVGSERDAPVPLAPAAETGTAHHFDVKAFARGLNRPTYVGTAPGDPDGIWVLEQPGRVVRLQGDRRTTVLDLRARVRTGAEQGLLGMAFHPDFAVNRRLYLHWSDLEGDTRVAEFRAGPGHDIEPRPLRELLFQRQPEENHNGGQLAFGPDGRLYLGLGDGGGAFDPRQTAQDPGQKLGKIIATSVEDRPKWETVVSGLRNPWRFSFDFSLGELWIADVGQDSFEEVNRVLLEFDEPPKNGGWSAYEGVRALPGERELSPAGELVWPVAGYSHRDGCSVTGGHVYMGPALPDLARRYVYGDFCSGTLWSLQGTPEGRATDVQRERAKLPQLTHIGVDADGELLFASASGTLYRAVAPIVARSSD